jgi:hypothetical protein
MSKIYLKKCKCCGEEFETNRVDQFFLNRLHQVSYNNDKQSLLRKRLNKINKPIMKTLRIYKELLGLKSKIRISKDFLRGKGANLAVFTHVATRDNEIINYLFDVAIINDGEFIILKTDKPC